MNTLTSMIGAQHASIIIPIIVLTSFIVYCPTRFVQERPIKVYSYFEKGCRKNLHATIPKDNMGYDQYTVPDDDCSCRTYFCCFPLALADICPWPLLPFFQISLKLGLSRALFPTTFLKKAVN